PPFARGGKTAASGLFSPLAKGGHRGVFRVPLCCARFVIHAIENRSNQWQMADGSPVFSGHWPLLPRLHSPLATHHSPLHHPDSLVIRVIKGRKRAMTMKPTMPPRTTIIIGSRRLTRDSTATSTSSS